MNRAAGRVLLALAVLGAWTALALLFAVSSSLTYMSTGRPPRWALTISMALADWWVWAVLTVPVLALARAWPLERGTLLRNIPLHTLAALAIAILKVAIDRWVRRSIFGFPISYFLISNLAPQIVIYWAIVGSAHGLAYYRRSRDRELLASHLEARLAEARLAALRTQLQPHFLFNTLNTIAELVHEDPETADRMISGLSDLLRETLALGAAQEVPLDREIELLRRYLEIQRVRFGERLAVEVQIPDDALAVRVPLLLLQPLVENAIRHGIMPRAGGGRIWIVARREGTRLQIEIADDGVGFSEAPVERVGLGGTRDRLATLYGDRQVVEIARRPGGGTIVRIEIPCGS